MYSIEARLEALKEQIILLNRWIKEKRYHARYLSLIKTKDFEVVPRNVLSFQKTAQLQVGIELSIRFFIIKR
jgi:hypothetical protein